MSEPVEIKVDSKDIVEQEVGGKGPNDGVEKKGAVDAKVEPVSEDSVEEPSFGLTDEQLDVIKDIVELIKKGEAKNIIVMSGAGISTSSGIPDFRTPGTGLYDNLQRYDLPYAEAIFDIEYFLEKPEAFFELASELFPGTNYLPSPTHHFINLLYKKGVLLRNFTQNIDGLEVVSGLDEDKVVEAHGHFRTSTCTSCRFKYVTKQHIRTIILAGEVPYCDKCKDGIIKPDITFFGEGLPENFMTRSTEDFPNCDLLIVMGTSLKVSPFNQLVNKINKKVPTLLINLEDSFRQFNRDPIMRIYSKSFVRRKILVNCDDGCKAMAHLLGWKDELDAMVQGFKHKPEEDEELEDTDELSSVLNKLKI